jgi:hypothetical protein
MIATRQWNRTRRGHRSGAPLPNLSESGRSGSNLKDDDNDPEETEVLKV